MTPDLIFDVGMNSGADSAFYLSKGFRVVAVEADPVLCAKARERFVSEVEAGRLVIEEAGIADAAGEATFYVNEVNSEFSAFDKAQATKDGQQRHHEVTVPTVRFESLLAKHGVPYYLKVDIELADRQCLEALPRQDLPKYVSIEAHRLDYLLLLHGLGYSRFKVVDQMRHNSRLPVFSNENAVSRMAKLACWYADRLNNKFGRGPYASPSSGPFGEDTAGPWESLEEVAYDWLHLYRGHLNRGTLNPRSWFDFHATRE